MKHVFLIHLMLFWTGNTTDEQISHADLFKNDLTTKHTISPYFSSYVKNEKGFEAHFYPFFELR